MNGLDQCRELEFPGSYFFNGERLINHMIRTIKVLDQDSCELQCYKESNCVSINFEFTGTYNCDLNNATHKEHGEALVKTEGYVYHGTIVSRASVFCMFSIRLYSNENLTVTLFYIRKFFFRSKFKLRLTRILITY